MRYWLFAVALLFGCAAENNSETNSAPEREALEIQEIDLEAVDTEVEALSTDHAKIAFLKFIMTEDQRVRKEETEALESFGYQSVEHKKAINNMMNVDALNLAKINAFTETYGAPEINSVGRMQSEATWYTVHHTSDIEPREQYYPILYSAWQAGMLSGSMFTMYLQRWCENETGERVYMEGAYTDEEEIAALQEKLGLD